MPYKFADSASYSYTRGDAHTLFLGACPETGDEVGIRTERHAITIAGARSGKGAAFIIPNLLRWPHAVLCIDPKGENAARTWEARRAMGQTVAVLDPFGVSGVPQEARAQFNPIADIEPYASRSRERIESLADGMVVVHDTAHTEWVEGARGIIAGVIAFVVSRDDMPRNLATVRQFLLMERTRLENAAHDMAGCDGCGGLARDAGNTILAALAKEKMPSEFLEGAKRATRWLDSPEIASCLESSSFDLRGLKTDILSLYLVLRPDEIRTYSAFFRLFVKAALKIMMTDEPEEGHRCLFILDEFYSLGKVELIAEAAGLMAGYGVTLWPFLQDLGQLKDLYGDNTAETFFNNADAEIYFNAKDEKTLSRISSQLEKMTVDELQKAPPEQIAFVEAPYRRWRWPYFVMSEKKGRAKHELEQRNLREVHRVKHGMSQAQYNHIMRNMGSARLMPSEIAALIGKGNDEKIARSAIVFAKAGDVLNVRLWPYYVLENPARKAALEKIFKNLYDDLEILGDIQIRETGLSGLARHLAPKLDISEKKFNLYTNIAVWGLFGFAVITGLFPDGLWSISKYLLPTLITETDLFNNRFVQFLLCYYFYHIIVDGIAYYYVDEMDYKLKLKIEAKYISLDMGKDAFAQLEVYRMKRYPKMTFFESLIDHFKRRNQRINSKAIDRA